jgi:hypothetical protein
MMANAPKAAAPALPIVMAYCAAGEEAKKRFLTLSNVRDIFVQIRMEEIYELHPKNKLGCL